MSDDYSMVPVHTADSFAIEQRERETSLMTSSADTDGQRAAAEVQAGIIVAQKKPRDEFRAIQAMKKTCERLSFAESAEFEFPRGGKKITGSTINLIREVARHWGNLDYGFREVSRGDGYSEVEAFAWDLEGNTRVRRVFQVNHIRDTKSGPIKIEAERDKYEHVAAQAQRRVRACLEQVIPVDVVEDCRVRCRQVVKRGDGTPLKDRINQAIEAFDNMGVSIDQIEAYLGVKAHGITPNDLVRLKGVYNAVKEGTSKTDDYFKRGSLVVTKDEPKAEVITGNGEVVTEPPKEEDGNPSQLTPEELAELEQAKNKTDQKKSGRSKRTKQGSLGV